MLTVERPTFSLESEQTQEAGFRYVDIFEYTARQLSYAYSESHSCPPPRIHPQSFNEIWQMRNELAKFKVSLGRSALDQEDYYSFIKTVNNPDQMIMDKYFRSDEKKIAIVPNEYPATMPEDAKHFLVWYLDSLPNSRVVDKIAEYIVSQELTTNDFVTYRKPPNNGPFLPGFSRSISLPHVHLITRSTSTS